MPRFIMPYFNADTEECLILKCEAEDLEAAAILMLAEKGWDVFEGGDRMEAVFWGEVEEMD
jgi:hypothetical protein